MDNDPVRDAMAAGFQALLRGDTAERDRQVERARKLMDAQAAVPKVDISRAEIVARLLRIAEHETGRPLAPAEMVAIERNPTAFMKGLIARGYKLPVGLSH